MGLVVGLSGYLHARRDTPRHRVSTGCSSIPFTFRDRAAFADWSCDNRRVVVNATETGVFAMLYEGQSWASRGVMRQPNGILLWDCVTHADIGRFATMADALSAHGDAVLQVATNNIYSIGGQVIDWASKPRC